MYIHRSSRRLLPLNSFYLVILIAVSSQLLSSCEDGGSTDPLVARGIALRKDIDKAHSKFEKSGIPVNMTDYSSVVVAHIPLGTSFEEAEAVLTATGFKFGRRPTTGDKARQEKDYGYQSGSCINPYVQHLISREILCVSLYTDKKFEFDKVTRIHSASGVLGL